MPGINGYPMLQVESVSARTATPSVDIGETRVESGKEFTYVYNGSTNEAINLGRGVKIASQSSGYTVDVGTIAPVTQTADVCFGVCQDATFATADYGWIMTKGKAASVQNMLSLVVTGEAIYLTTSGAFRRLSTSSVISGLVTVARAGRAIDAPANTTSTGTFNAWIGNDLS